MEAWHGRVQLYVLLKMESLTSTALRPSSAYGTWYPAHSVRTHGCKMLYSALFTPLMFSWCENYSGLVLFGFMQLVMERELQATAGSSTC